LACNHCETPVCLEGCPTSSYRREPQSGAVIIDERKCIGCKYCQWNCPYDAPKFDPDRGIIGKCNLCYTGLAEGRLPACSSGCPTGALSYGELTSSAKQDIFPWFPDKNLNPAIELAGGNHLIPLLVVPERTDRMECIQLPGKDIVVRGEWSLVAFSFLSVISVGTIISSLIRGIFPNEVLFLSIIILTGIISLFHAGKLSGVWRSVVNLKSSPLSREIALFIIYSIMSCISVMFHLPGLLVASSIAGLIFLIMIDSVYFYADKTKSVIMHSGQTFLSGLIIVSFYTGFVFPFVFIALIKLLLSVNRLIVNKITGMQFGLRFIRIAFLMIAGISMISEISYPDPVVSSIFISGELIDRIIFYFDFRPLHIETEIIKHINIQRNETKRG
jgi:ferredoxin